MSEFKTSRQDTIKVYPSSNIYRRVWLSIQENYSKDRTATELSIWDIDILIPILAKARKALTERD